MARLKYEIKILLDLYIGYIKKSTMTGNIPSFILQGMTAGFAQNYFSPGCMPFGCGRTKYPGFLEEQPTTEIGTNHT